MKEKSLVVFGKNGKKKKLKIFKYEKLRVWPEGVIFADKDVLPTPHNMPQISQENKQKLTFGLVFKVKRSVELLRFAYFFRTIDDFFLQ
jgi:hypothetical protein